MMRADSEHAAERAAAAICSYYISAESAPAQDITGW